MARSKVRKIEVRQSRGRVQVRLIGEAQRGAQYIIRSIDTTPEELDAELRKLSFWEGTGVNTSDIPTA